MLSPRPMAWVNERSTSLDVYELTTYVGLQWVIHICFLHASEWALKEIKGSVTDNALRLLQIKSGKLERDNDPILNKWANPSLFFYLFSSFQTHITNFTTNIYVKQCPSSLRCWDSNPRPSEHESPPITTRPGRPILLWSEAPLPFGMTKHRIFSPNLNPRIAGKCRRRSFWLRIAQDFLNMGSLVRGTKNLVLKA